MITKCKPVELIALRSLREAYFKSISLSQELMLEWLVVKGSGYEISDNETVVGYFIKSADNILVEFYLTDSHISQQDSIFGHILELFSITKTYCKSFDHHLLTCCHAFCQSSKIIGTLFRNYRDTSYLNLDNEMSVRLAGKDDIPFLLTFDSELYETPEELHFTVSNQMLYLFEKGQTLIGCGYFIKILSDKDYYDIGMWTNPAFRNQGYAIKIIAWLKKYCLERGFSPICGCAAENTASRKTLERNGFIAKHSLIEFDFV